MGILSKFFNTPNASTETEMNSLDTSPMASNFTDLTLGLQSTQL